MDDESATEILDATYRALREHGYADLTLQDIAAEADKSKSLIHYHYDSKENLFAEFLEYLYERYTTRLESVGGDTPRERLHALVEAVLDDDTAPGREFRTAMLALNAQAPHDAAIRSRLAEFDDALFERFREVVAAGVEAGAFSDRVDPALAAEFLVTAVAGAHARRAGTEGSTDRIREAMTRCTESHLADGGTEVAH